MSRIGVPSLSSDAKASDSACAQSIPPSSPSVSARRSSCLTSFGWTLKPGGIRSRSWLSSDSRSAATAVLTSGDGRAVELVAARRLVAVARGELGLELAMAVGQVVPDVLGELVGLLLRHDAALDELRGVELSRRRLLLDLGRHLRLRVRGLVGLVVTEAAVADQVDQHVVAELLPERVGEPDGRDAGGDVVGVDVDDRDVEALREVRRPARGAGVVRIRREADLVVLDQVQRAADRVAVERLQVQGLGDDALAGEGGIAVQDDGQRRVVVEMRVRALAGRLQRAGRALDHRPDVLEVAGVGLQPHDDRGLVGQLVGALGAVVVLDVAGPALRDRRHRLDRRGALELPEDRLVAAAEAVREHVEPAAVRHAQDHLARAVGGRELDHLVEHRHGHVEPLDRELLLAEVGLVHEALERVDLRQPAQQRALLLVRQRGAERARLDLLAQPGALAVRRDVLDLVGDRPAVGLAQVREGVRERGARDVGAQDLGRDPGHQLRRQPDGLGIERRIALGLGHERVELGGQMAVHAVRLEERRGGLDGLQQRLVDLAVGRRRGRSGIAHRRGGGRRRGRLRRGAERRVEFREDLLVEPVLTLQIGLDDLEELARLRALDDAMVVGRRHRHHLVGADHRADPGQAGRIADRARGHDRALALHQPRDRGDRADAAGIGERQVRALQVVGRQLVVARLGDQRTERLEEAGEVEPARVPDHRDHQGAPTVLALDVDGDAEVHGAVVDHVRLAVLLVEVPRHHRHLLRRRARDRVGDEMRERDLVPRLLELAAAGVEHRDGERAERGRGRHGARLVHVAREHRRGALDLLCARGLRRPGPRRCPRSRRPARPPWRCGRRARCRARSPGRSRAPRRRGARPA